MSSESCLPVAGPTISSCTVVPSSTVRDLGVYIDSDLSMIEISRSTDCFTLLQRSTPAAKYLPSSSNCSVSVVGCRSGSQPARLLQQCAGLATCQPHSATSVGSECSSTAHLQDSSVRPYHRCADQPSLAAST